MLLIQLKIMPASPETDLEKIKTDVNSLLEAENQKILADEVQPVAFGIKSLLLTFTWPDEKNADEIEEKVGEMESVNSATVVDVRRAIG